MKYRKRDYEVRQASARQFVNKIASQNSQLFPLLDSPLTSNSLISIHNVLKSKQSLTWNENVSSIYYTSILRIFNQNRDIV